MATIKKPAIREQKRKEIASPTLMGNQDTKAKGEGKAMRTEKICISTTPEIVEAVRVASFEKKLSRSKLVEEALISYLNL